MSYSVAIRTLGTSPDTLKKELESLHNQTIMPDKIVVYIARGYSRPDFSIGIEQYVDVPKGMVAQRALDYKEIDSEYLFLLDDDVVFARNSAEILLSQLIDSEADCVAVDTFANHKMTILAKAKAAVSNLVFPYFGQKWAFMLHSNGSFYYINNPRRDLYLSQSAAGPASLWKKSSLLAISLEDELWLDSFGFAYGDDDLEFYKLYINGGKLMVSFSSGVVNLDSKSSSAAFQKSPQRLFVRSMSNLIRWHRMHYLPRNKRGRILASLSFTLKESWMAAIHMALSIVQLNPAPIRSFLGGMKKGRAYIRSNKYKQLPKYKNEDFVLR